MTDLDPDPQGELTADEAVVLIRRTLGYSDGWVPEDIINDIRKILRRYDAYFLRMRRAEHEQQL